MATLKGTISDSDSEQPVRKRDKKLASKVKEEGLLVAD